jgi:hypothetical protein
MAQDTGTGLGLLCFFTGTTLDAMLSRAPWQGSRLGGKMTDLANGSGAASGA